MRSRRLPVTRSVIPAILVLAIVLSGCSTYQRFDSVSFLRDQFQERLGSQARLVVNVPFELSPELAAIVEERVPRSPDERRQLEYVSNFIFSGLELEYSLLPTRNAVEAYYARAGNCLSFVNLFVGVSRQIGLDPFYVEVTDYQRWNLRDGTVISQGHIVAGLYVKGELSTFDFLPYRPKSYKEFQQITDLAAAGHYYNNLGAEALIKGDLQEAERLLRLAVGIAPTFEKALNNLGVVLFRQGRTEDAVEVYRQGLEAEPKSVAILTNMAKVHQERGELDQAMALLEQIDTVQNTNPFFFIYRGELALAQGDFDKALTYMRDALRRDSEIPEVHLGFVKVYLASGDLEKAKHHLGRALTIDATNDEARRYAALIERQAP